MGSLVSSPSIPAPAPQVIYVPQTSASQDTSQTQTSAPTDQGAAQDRDAERSKTRVDSLLTRERGLFGTIQTGFRGLPGLNDQAAKRKTLLGE